MHEGEVRFYHPTKSWHQKGLGQLLVLVVLGLLIFIAIVGFSALWQAKRLKQAPTVEFLSGAGFSEDTQLALEASSAVGMLEYSSDASLGPAEADLKIVAYMDFNCSYSKTAAGIMRELSVKYPRRFYYAFKNFPLPSDDADSIFAAEAARCALEQGKFWEKHD
ncbi:MAG: DsbA family protein, partial [bacterium]